ncbi:hypothetical protein C806_00601 [Lachnospiraceae bacterium 3-1]|nr:hypothetical protein C806_00601 [Lachnospiraceae bacterium 3-1]
MNHKEFKNIMQMQIDCIINGTGKILLFFGYAIYFILAVQGEYKVPMYMANLSTVISMIIVFYVMVRFTRREGEHWRSMYEKIRYFPIDRKKYLLAQSIPVIQAIGLLILLQWVVFAGRILAQREIALEAMVRVSLQTLVSGSSFFVGFLGLTVIGEGALYLFPLPFVVGMGLANLAGNFIMR